jgi:hypothetical protein
VELRPVAKVHGVVSEALAPQVWGMYTREDAAALFGHIVNPSWRVGHRDLEVNGEQHSVFFVTLRKRADTKIEHRYADRFLSPDEFQWESQASTSPEGLKGQRIIGHEAEGRTIHLFARYQAKKGKKPEDFVYCGPLHYQRHEGSKPIRIWFELERPLPDRLYRLWRE